MTPRQDGVAENIRGFDGPLDPARADGLLTALELLRDDAGRDARLDFELLQRWQRHALGTSQLPPLRSRPAFAKGGRKRYGIAPDIRARLDACLAESAYDAARPLPLTNARSAFHALIFVLTREGIALDGVVLLRRVFFQADEPKDALALASCTDTHITATRRRAVSPDRAP
ncbi:hypothetical protein [Streptomyces sp. FXY-T5]|uniref:hypothetical protein n=1 Tax=Streptomyces sp. FXY-T5 TaxID=3064901 RepID=UPI0027D20A09|nr:hypothetical protein [Streptomyces sp. FXY-T5]WMD06177.1 hypothetical protein Q7C01_17990 [Streptomyces sp. FXY-T5]